MFNLRRYRVFIAAKALKPVPKRTSTRLAALLALGQSLTLHQNFESVVLLKRFLGSVLLFKSITSSTNDYSNEKDVLGMGSNSNHRKMACKSF